MRWTSANVTCCLECGSCQKQCMGTRLKGHRADIIHKLPKTVAEQFNLPGHSLDNKNLFLIQTQLVTTRGRNHTESYLINGFKTPQRFEISTFCAYHISLKFGAAATPEVAHRYHCLCHPRCPFCPHWLQCFVFFSIP